MTYQEEFITFMVRSGVLTFGDFTTKSGRKTPYFVNTGNYKTGAQAAKLGAYYAACIPAGTYSGQTEDLNTFGAKCLLCVRADAPDELVYQLTQTLYHGAEELAQSTPALAEMARPEFLYEDLPIPLHQGAADFYRAEGLIES